MLKLTITVLLCLNLFSITQSSSFNIGKRAMRLLQEAEAPGSTKSAPDSTKKKPYKPFVPPTQTDDWKGIRESFYKHEDERLNRERTFHSSEFQRYVRQQKWNDERTAIETDKKKTIAARVRELM